MHSMYGGLRTEGMTAATIVAAAEASKPTRLIGLTAPARAGKDTVGEILSRVFSTQRLSFAEPIRNALRGMLNLTDEHFHGALKEVPLPYIGKSPRQLMQTLGTEWGRGLIHDQLWLILASNTIKEHRLHGRSVVVTDVRFENEAKFIRDMGGEVWHIKRGSAVKVNAHVSEAGVQFEPGDLIIDNNGSLEELWQRVVDLYGA